MSDTVSKYIELAIGTAFMALLLSVVMRFASIGNSVALAYQKEQDANYRLQEYAKYAEYDDTIVSGADAIACIYKFAYSSTVPESGRDFRVYVETVEYFSDDTIDYLESVIDPVGTYYAVLSMNVNGAAEAVRFD